MAAEFIARTSGTVRRATLHNEWHGIESPLKPSSGGMRLTSGPNTSTSRTTKLSEDHEVISDAGGLGQSVRVLSSRA
jgi:hypothetical protein